MVAIIGVIAPFLLGLATIRIFFLHMGMQVDLRALFSVKAIVVGLVLAVAAVA